MEGLVGDDDTTAITRINEELDPNIQKQSDKNHVKKNIANSLYNLQKTHKSLSTKIIKYIQKCFNYMVSQNQGSPSGIEKGLTALSFHSFDNHKECDKLWCHHKRDIQLKSLHRSHIVDYWRIKLCSKTLKASLTS